MALIAIESVWDGSPLREVYRPIRSNRFSPASLNPPQPRNLDDEVVPLGDPVDQTIHALEPHLDPGDILIDGGNSNYNDSQRRAAGAKSQTGSNSSIAEPAAASGGSRKDTA